MENAGATNRVVTLTALPGGYRNNNGTFNNIGNNGNWWSSTENNTTNAWNRNLNYNYNWLERYYLAVNSGLVKTCGVSVRCIRDN